MEIVFATGNKHKAQEAEAILKLANPKVQVLTYSGPEPIESGTTFLENAMIKARAAFEATGQLSFADDSGIACEVMGGAPGIFSAIWSGTRDDATNRNLLLKQLEDIPAEHRAAAFICTIALVGPDEEVSFTGIWPGTISFDVAGDGGFGYDPVFVPEGLEVTAAELEPEVKNSMSHRSMALQQMAEYLARR
ncbi:MAG: RdgB/HAM1 family non-canonical purine NTP pyrophosphatase [Actinomycetota bacterium]|nr:RdgB/HAM1 family non-canonical purine NTP pyrophosphatase [Actinomycetota bacterium]